MLYRTSLCSLDMNPSYIHSHVCTRKILSGEAHSEWPAAGQNSHTQTEGDAVQARVHAVARGAGMRAAGAAEKPCHQGGPRGGSHVPLKIKCPV